MELIPKYHPNSSELEELLLKFRKKIQESEFPFTPRTDREFLLKFLRMKKYSLDNAFRKIKKYYDNVERNSDIANGVRPSDFEILFRDGPFKTLKNRCKGRRIWILSVRKWKPKEIPLDHVHVIGYHLLEHDSLEIETQDNGVVFLLDFKDLSFGQIWQLSPKAIQRVMNVQEGAPVRISEIHFIHPPPLFWTLFKIVNRFLKEKIRKRLYIHSDLETLRNFIDPSICPESIGGNLSDEEAHDVEFIEEVLKKYMYFEDMWDVDRIKEDD